VAVVAPAAVEASGIHYQVQSVGVAPGTKSAYIAAGH